MNRLNSKDVLSYFFLFHWNPQETKKTKQKKQKKNKKKKKRLNLPQHCIYGGTNKNRTLHKIDLRDFVMNYLES